MYLRKILSKVKSQNTKNYRHARSRRQLTVMLNTHLALIDPPCWTSQRYSETRGRDEL